MTHTQVIAHRGACAHAPENTLAAFRRAAALGSSAIETDLRVTREGRFVLLHDARVNRTTNGRGRIADLPFGAVRRLDAGSWFAAEFAGERVPTLEETLALAAELDLGIYLELKTSLEGALPFALAEALRRLPRPPRIVLLAFDARALVRMRSVRPRLETGLLVGRADPMIEKARRMGSGLLAGRTGPKIEVARRAGARLLAPRARRVSARLVERAHEAGLGVVAWTVNEPKEMRRLLALGVEGLMTDWPDRLIETIGQTASYDRR